MTDRDFINIDNKAIVDVQLINTITAEGSSLVVSCSEGPDLAIRFESQECAFECLKKIGDLLSATKIQRVNQTP